MHSCVWCDILKLMWPQYKPLTSSSMQTSHLFKLLITFFISWWSHVYQLVITCLFRYELLYFHFFSSTLEHNVLGCIPSTLCVLWSLNTYMNAPHLMYGLSKSTDIACDVKSKSQWYITISLSWYNVAVILLFCMFPSWCHVWMQMQTTRDRMSSHSEPLWSRDACIVITYWYCASFILQIK